MLASKVDMISYYSLYREGKIFRWSAAPSHKMTMQGIYTRIPF